MASFGTAYLDIAGNTAPLKAEIDGLASGPLGKKMEALGKSLTRNLTLPIVGVGVAAAKLSMDFQRSMTLVSTQAGGTHKEVKKLGAEILKLSQKGRFAQGPNELAKALFNLESVGFRGSKAMKALKAASDLATVGNADLESTTSALAGVLKTGIKGAGNMHEAIGTLNATIGAGKMHMEDLNSAIGTGFLGKAAGLGVSLSGIGAALAELTSQGTPANSAATRLRMTMSLMAAPTEKAQGALASIGIGSEDLAKKMRSSGSLIPALKELKEHLDGLSKVKQSALISEAFGGSRSGGTIEQLLNAYGDLSEKQEQVVKNSHDIGKAIKETNADPEVKMKKAWSAIQATLIQLGDVILPIVVPMFEKVAGFVDKIGEKFQGLSPSSKKLVVEIGFMVAALGPGLTIAGKLVGTYSTLVSWINKATAATGLFATAEEGAGVAAVGSATVAGDSTYSLARSFGRGRVASSIAQSGEFAMAGAAGARSIAASLATKLGPAVAAVGVGNVVTSALNKDWRDVGFEAGGAIAGGIAGFMVGGPAGAMLGVGLGSIGGELISGLFASEKKLTPVQRTLARTSQALATALDGQKRAANTTAEAQDNLHRANSRLHASTKNLSTAEHHLEEVRSQHKTGSIEILKAEADLHERHRANTRAANEQRFAEEALAFARKAQGRSIAQVFHDSSQAIAGDKQWIAQIKQRISVEGWSKSATEAANRAAQKLARDEGTRSQALDQARQRNQAWAKSLEGMTEAQNRFGANGKALATHIENLRERVEALRQDVSRSGGPLSPFSDSLRKARHELSTSEQKLTGFISSTGPKLKNWATQGGHNAHRLGGSFEALSGSVGESLQQIIANTQGVMKAFGAAKIPSFEVKALHSQFGSPGAANIGALPELGRQGGGFIVPGSGDGDKFRTALPPDSFILNRKATTAFGFNRGGHLMPVALEAGERAFLPHEVKAIGGPGTLEAMNRAVPRFQKGGGLGPEPQVIGPSGALRSMGQAAIQRVYEGAKAYIAEHKPKGGLFAGPTPAGVGIFQGLPVDKWIIPELLYAVAHGWKGHITSGYRTPAHSAALGFPGDEHTKTSYPGGAVDFGGMSDPAGAANRAAFIAATKGYRGPKLRLPVGFHDDGHMSGTGHRLGGIVQALLSGGKVHGPPLFTREGPAFYADALKHNQPWATHQAPWQTHLNGRDERQFEAWVKSRRVPFDPTARRVDYDMRGFWKATGGNWSGGHFPDTWKTPFDTSFSNQSRYAKRGTPFTWMGDKLVDRRSGQIVFEEMMRGGLLDRVQKLLKGGGVLSPEEWAEAMISGGFPKIQKVIAEGLGTIKSESSFNASEQSQGPGGHIGGWAESPTFGSVAERLNPVRSSAAAYKEWKKDSHSFWQAWGQWEAEQSGLAGGGAGAYGPEYMGTAKQVIDHGVTGTEHSFKEDVPAIYRGCRTDSLNFPSIPKSLHGVEHELKRWESEISKYRRTVKVAQKANKPGVAQALEHNVTAISTQLNKLRDARRKLRFDKAKKALAKRLSKKLGKFARYETGIEGLQRDFNIASQFAEQVVDLEPVQPELPGNATDAQREAAEKDYVARFTDYVNDRERPAYGDVLGKAGTWRNAILQVEDVVHEQEWTWEGGIRRTDAEIDHINDFTQKVAEHLATFRKDHPKEKLPDWLTAQIKQRDALRAKLPWLRVEDGGLRKSLGEARGEFFAGGKDLIKPPALSLAGSGALEEHLTEVQGIHWPDQHSLLSSLPARRIAGMFGGAIWDAQTTIEELGLKISEAASGLGGGSGGEGEGDSERTSLVEELARQANQRAAVSDAQKVVLEDWDAERKGFLASLPRFHEGGTPIFSSSHQEAPIMVERGESVLSADETSRVERAMAGAADGEMQVIVNGDIVQEKGDRRDPVEVVLGDRRFAPAVQKASRAGRGIGLLTPGGARR